MAGILFLAFLFVQASAGPLAFEVASVKPIQQPDGPFIIRPLPGGQTYVARNTTVHVMIKLMYKLSDSQIVGEPSWLETDGFDIEAKAPKPSTLDELHEMFQTLLADRFKLRFHRETRDIQAYVLTVDKGGPKFKQSDSQDPFDIPVKSGPTGPMIGTRVSMERWSYDLAQWLRVPVVDNTGLPGYYDFKFDWRLQWPPDDASIFSALREQLGLKLESRKAPVEVFVIESVSKPEDN